MLGLVPVAEVSGAALVNGVAAWQQVLNMVQAAQAAWVHELEARTPDALRHVPDELACALVSTRRHAENLFLRAWGTAQHPALADAWAAGAVDARKVDVILDEVGRAGGSLSRSEVAAVVVADAVDRAEAMTAPAAGPAPTRGPDRRGPGRRRAAARGGTGTTRRLPGPCA